MELRVVLPAGAVLEHRHRNIGGQDPDMPLPVTDPGIGAVAEHRFSSATRAASLCASSMRERNSGSATAQSADTLLSAEKVMSRPAERFSLPAFLVSFWEPSGAKPVIEAVEVGAVDLAAVLEPSRPLGLNQTPSGSSPAV